jgi:hypothetical protein
MAKRTWSVNCLKCGSMVFESQFLQSLQAQRCLAQDHDIWMKLGADDEPLQTTK